MTYEELKKDPAAMEAAKQTPMFKADSLFTHEEVSMMKRLLKRHIIDCQDIIPAARNAVKDQAEVELNVCMSVHEKLMCIK